jgi:hypothetical protein
MTESEERQKQASALLDYLECNRRLALLKRDAVKMAERLEQIAKFLRETPRRIDSEDGYLPSYSEIFTVAKNIKLAETELAELRQLAKTLGAPVDND